MSVYSTLLIVDDDVNNLKGLKQYLDARDYDVLTASSGEEALELIKKEKPDLVLTDVRMPGMQGTELLEQIKKENVNTEVILLTAYGSVEDAVKAMKNGAYYYLTKPINLEELDFLVRKALNSRNLKEENKELRQALFRQKHEQGEILVNSAKMQNVLKDVERVAASNATVLIEGESGVGKELIAHRIHALSERSERPFIAVHCAALTETLLASELFGHEKGSFTGASERKIGRFERAHTGTLFLDEIGEIPHDTQVKLLRVLQEREFERVGGTKTIKVDVRLICATNKKLLEEVREGRFREDLYYRLNVINMKVPPLRERIDDIDLLLPAFIKEFSRSHGKVIHEVDPKIVEALKKYDWPGNIREFKNIIERMLVLNQSDKLTLEDVPDDIFEGSRSKNRPADASAIMDPTHQLEDVEREFIKSKLAEARGNKSLAAKKLGISRRTLYRKIEEYRLA